MELNFRCLESDHIETQMNNLFLVEKNFQKYFLKTNEDVSLYELALEKSLKKQNVVISLLYHKVIENRFAGIYRFQSNRGTLKDYIKNNTLTLYDKYSFMKSITHSVLLALKDRNRKNDIFQLNLIPRNILVLDQIPYGVTFIEIIPSDQVSMDFAQFIDNSNSQKYSDTHSSNILLLGRIFHYICFNLENINIFNEDMIRTLDEYLKNHDRIDIHSKITRLVRIMLNKNPIDRPSFEVILNTLEEVLNSWEFLFENYKDWLYYGYYDMKKELDMETFDHANKHLYYEQNKLEMENEYQLLKKIKKKGKRLQKTENIIELGEVPKKVIENILKKVRLVTIERDVSDKDLGMINDMTPSDFEKFDTRKPNYQFLAKSQASDIYINDLYDLKHIVKELLSPYFQGHDLREYFLSTSNGFYSISESNWGKEFERTMKVSSFFYQFYFNELKVNSKHFKEQNNYFLNEEDDTQKKVINESLWKKLTWIPPEHILIMIICQILTLIFGIMFFARNTNFEKFQKKNFNTYISLN